MVVYTLALFHLWVLNPPSVSEYRLEYVLLCFFVFVPTQFRSLTDRNVCICIYYNSLWKTLNVFYLTNAILTGAEWRNNLCCLSGYKRLMHSGGIVTYGSMIWMFPEMNFGIFAVVSGPQNRNRPYAIKAIVSQAEYMLLGENPWLNKTTEWTYMWHQK